MASHGSFPAQQMMSSSVEYHSELLSKEEIYNHIFDHAFRDRSHSEGSPAMRLQAAKNSALAKMKLKKTKGVEKEKVNIELMIFNVIYLFYSPFHDSKLLSIDRIIHCGLEMCCLIVYQ